MMVVVRVAPCPSSSSSSSSSSKTTSTFNTNRNWNRNHARLPYLRFSKASGLSSSSSSSSAASQPPQMAAPAPAVDLDVDVDVDVFQTIRAHQEAAARLAPVVEARTLLYQTIRGVLSTLSLEHEGYPSGSMVDFACHEDGSPILTLSSLAVHSKNLSANAKCCLLVAKDPEDRTDTVITLYGDAIPVAGEEREQVRAAYLKRHPGAFWVDFGDFRFIQIKPRFIRYVSGVATALLGSGEFTAEEFKTAKVDPISQFAKPIMSHMNKDHSDDTKLIVQHLTSVKVDSAYMLDVDSLGFNVKMAAPAPAVDLDVDVDVFQTIRAHQEAAARLAPVVEARTLLYQTIRGVLSTLSLEHEGYPSGSMVDFACHEDGSPILTLSSLAVHSKNLSANAKCCLLVAKDPEDRTDTVITLYGDAIPVAGEEREQVRAAYLKRHPGAFWVDFGDFRFIQIKPRFIRYVSGVATALLGSGEFTAEEFKTAKVDPISQFAKPIMSHMNKDHSDDTKLIVQHSTSVKVDSAYMLDVDSLGFNVKAEYDGRTMKLRIPFPRPAQDRKDVKTLIVEMLQAAKAGAVPRYE